MSLLVFLSRAPSSTITLSIVWRVSMNEGSSSLIAFSVSGA